MSEPEQPTGGEEPTVLGVPNAEVEPAEAPEAPDEAPSPADLELSSGALAPGETILVKQNAEVPTQLQVDAAVGEVAGPPVVKVTVTDGEGTETQSPLRPDDSALISQRAAEPSAAAKFANTIPGWSNPALVDPTEEERQADHEAYLARFGG